MQGVEALPSVIVRRKAFPNSFSSSLYFRRRAAGRDRAAAEPEVGKTTVNMRFDSALLKRIDRAAKGQGISRTAWLHVAASRALE